MKTIASLPGHLFARQSPLLVVLAFLATISFGPPSTRAAVIEAWAHRYDNVMSNSIDQAVKVVRDAAGDIIVTGTTSDRMYRQDMLTIKYSGADGSVLWQQRSTSTGGGAQAMAVDDSGNVVVTGYATTVKYAAADGTRLWERYDAGGQAVAVDGNGNVAVAGKGYSNGQRTAKYAANNGALLWEKFYYEGQAVAVAVDGSGDVVMTGSTYAYRGLGATNAKDHQNTRDYYTAKYASANGALLWEKRYNGPANGDDRAQALALDGSGNVVVTGYSLGSGSGYDYYTAKYASANGSLLWEKRYNGPANSYDSAQAVATDGAGNVLVTGTSENGTNNHYTAKYAVTDGALLWEQRNGRTVSPPYYNASAVVVDGSGNVVVTEGGATVKYAAANGALLWEKSSTNHAAAAVVVDGSGNVMVTGSLFDQGSASPDYYTARYATTDGALIWEQGYNGPTSGYDQARAVAVDASGHVVVTGSSTIGYDECGYPISGYYTAKYAAASGALVWEQRYRGLTYSSEPIALAIDGGGNAVVTGFSIGTNFSYDYYTAKYAAADGALLWEQRYSGPANYDFVQAVAVDSSGNVLVTGSSVGTSPDCYTAKYAAADGATLWEQRFTNAAGAAVAVDGSDNVIVTGTSYKTNSSDYYTAKYAAANGALLWEQRATNGGASAVAVDRSGNVLVTGSSLNGTNSDYYTAKYAAADGTLHWEKRYNSPANGDDYGQAVAVDSSGNVVVTGASYNETNNDYYTARYAAADGALLWEKRYNGPANGYDLPTAVAVDGGGNVLVAGSSAGTNGYYDYYTVRYAAADGALLWEKRYDAANATDTIAYRQSLALGPNGMVAVTGTSSDDFATVVYRENLFPMSIALVPGGTRLHFPGVPDRTYVIERAPTVTGPWIAINFLSAPASGLIEYTDTSSPPEQAFYRIAQP
jgi:uncharacterized delta-60 repeat protein